MIVLAMLVMEESGTTSWSITDKYWRFGYIDVATNKIVSHLLVKRQVQAYSDN